ncbi:MAG: hypothetical protein KGZ30_01370, partial [Anaplasmataceae bacterium]|nr:hypothetical protein [Anaplasmataceae bacterium]
MENGILRGVGVVGTISARKGGTAEELLRQIAHPGEDRRNPLRATRKFPEWVTTNGYEETRGVVHLEDGRVISLRLRLGEPLSGLRLIDDHFVRKTTLRDSGGMTIKIGSDLPKTRIPDFANNIVGHWVVHGAHWKNRSGKIFCAPYGEGQGNFLDHGLRFDNASSMRGMRLEEVVRSGAVHAVPLGEWGRPYTIVPAALGATVLLREFNFHGHYGDENVFSVVMANTDRDHQWPGYCGWRRWEDKLFGARIPDHFREVFSEIAASSRTPFHFHLHATKSIFPKVRLLSAYLLEVFGRRELERLLQLVVENHPERFSLLLDARAQVHELDHVYGDSLIYKGGRRFELERITRNVAETFQSMAEVEANPGFVIPAIDRVIPDHHLYLALLILAGHNLHLSGQNLYRRVLVDERSVEENQVRVGELLKL